MDEVDKTIVMTLFKDGRISKRKIAEEVGMTGTALYYRFDKLLERKIIKSFSLYVSPNFYNKYLGVAVFMSEKDIDADFINIKVKCLNEAKFYELEGFSVEDLKDKISYMSKILGKPKIAFIPSQNPQKPSGIDIEIVKQLIKNPVIRIGEISKAVGISVKSVKHRMNALTNKNYIKLIPVVELDKANIAVFVVYSQIISELEFLKTCEFLRFTDYNRGVGFCVTSDLKEVEGYMKEIKRLDPSSQIMIITDYEIMNKNAERELEKIEHDAIKRVKFDDENY